MQCAKVVRSDAGRSFLYCVTDQRPLIPPPSLQRSAAHTRKGFFPERGTSPSVLRRRRSSRPGDLLRCDRGQCAVDGARVQVMYSCAFIQYHSTVP